MKKRTKTLAVLMAATTLIVGSVLGTLAYLTDKTETVENTFTVGDVDIILDETDVDEMGNPITDADRVTENEYHLLPGHEYVKDPMVTVDGDSEDCYVRMIVTMNKSNAFNKIFAAHPELKETDFLDINHTEYPDYTVTLQGDERVFEFRYPKVVSTDVDFSLPAIFTTVKMPGVLTNEEIATLEGLKINVVAHAIQVDGFADADAAWTAFDAQVK